MGLAGEFGSITHLVARFFGALSPAGPQPDDERWALDQLLPGEQALWRRMSGPDRRHAIGVARGALEQLSTERAPAGREVVASALLHDVGKIEAGLGTFARVAATLAAIVLGRRRLTGATSVPTPAVARHGARERVAVYLAHDRVGAQLLRQAGSHPTTVAWAAEHHLPAERWSLDRRVADALKAADGD